MQKRAVVFAILLLSFVPFAPATTQSFWGSCMEVDKYFYYNIVDPGIIEIGNGEYYAFVPVDCDIPYTQQPFSKCANGCPIYPNGAVKIMPKTEVCKGDVFYVYRNKCWFGKIKKKHWP